MKTILGKWSNVALAIVIVVINFLFLIRVGLAYGPYDWVRYLGNYGDGAYGGPYGVYSTYVVLVAGFYPVYPLPPVRVVAPCVAAPSLFDPPDGKASSTRNMVLRWKSDYELKSDEFYDVLTWMGDNDNPISIGTTRDKLMPLDMIKWQFAGNLGKFMWNVRIKGLDGSYRSCESQPFSFTLTGLPDVPVPAAVPNQPPPKQPCYTKPCP